jgi:hypothetical protein
MANFLSGIGAQSEHKPILENARLNPGFSIVSFQTTKIGVTIIAPAVSRPAQSGVYVPLLGSAFGCRRLLTVYKDTTASKI